MVLIIGILVNVDGIEYAHDNIIPLGMFGLNYLVYCIKAPCSMPSASCTEDRGLGVYSFYSPFTYIRITLYLGIR